MSAALKVLRLRPSAQLPTRGTPGAAGLDLHADLAAPVVMEAHGGRALIGTGLSIALPHGCEGQVRPRSGLALKHGVTVLNAPGTIDEDYRGEVSVLLVNHGADPFTVSSGMRIAQLVVARYEPAVPVEVVELDATARGAGGYGSTGT